MFFLDFLVILAYTFYNDVLDNPIFAILQRRFFMPSHVPCELFSPVSHLLKSSSPVTLLGYYPQSLPAPYLFLQAAFLVKGTYPYRYTQIPFEGWALLYTESGQGILSQDEGDISLNSGNLIWISCALGYSVHAVSSHWNHFLLYFNGRECEYFHTCFLNALADKQDFFLSSDSRFSNILHSLKSRGETAFSNPMEQLFLSTSLLTEALSHLQENKTVRSCPSYLLEIRRILDEEYQYPYSLDLLEQRFQISKFKISREFSYFFSQSPIAYLTARRIQAAKDLLATTSLQIQEISQNVGYSSSTLFIRSFKKAEQITPQEYRRRCSRIST